MENYFNDHKQKQKTVVLALSGGIDSSLCAYLLKQKYKVICVFIKCWDSTLNADVKGKILANNLPIQGCEYIKEYQNAKLVADSLNLKLEIFDFVEEYWNLVFKNFINDIKKGYTPNPDINCNSIIKFNLFVQKAKKIYNPNFIATGHYAKIEKINNHFSLSEAKDKSKDQTYFLSTLKEAQLKQIIFPLANIYKKDVKKLLIDANINVNFNQKSSAGICFVGKRNFKEFLSNYLPIKKGKIIDFKTNQPLKEKHDGYYFYTIGQRKGLNLGGYTEKHFVIKKDIKKNFLYVSSINDKNFLKLNGFYGRNMHFINPDYYLTSDHKVVKNRFNAVLRYQAKKIKILIENYNFNEKKIKIIFSNPQISITPGQFCVLYDNSICVGACVIDEVIYSENKVFS